MVNSRRYVKLSLVLLIGLFLLTSCGEERIDRSRLEVITAQPVAIPATPTTLSLFQSGANSATPTPNPTEVAPTANPTLNSQPSPTATALPTPTLEPIKQGVLLEPMDWEPQTWNNCAPVSAKIALSYYGIKLTQEQCQKALRPNTADKLVRPEEVVNFIQKQGLKAVLRENGTLDRLKALLSAGFPVITEQWLEEDDDIAHYRTARGYDLAKNTFIFNDSMDRKPNTVVGAELQDKLWKAFNRRYIVLYRAPQEARVMQILGEDADLNNNLVRSREAAQKYTATKPNDVDGWSNLGFSEYALGNCETALSVWETKLRPRLVPSESGPFNRYLWYELWPVECYKTMGKYDQIIKIAPNEIAQTGAYAEMRYLYAVALINTGRKEEGITQLKKAALDDPNYSPVEELLGKLAV